MIEKNNRFQIAAHIVMILLCIFCLFPFLILISSSITSEMTLVREGYSILPKNIDFSAYKYLLTSSDDIIRGYIITICVTVIGTVANLTLTILLAYPLSRRDLPHRNVFAFIVFFTMLFHGGIVPSYIMWSKYFHITNTYAALIIPNLMMGAYYVIMVRTYFQSNIPEAVLEAGRIDGAGEMRILGQIVLPMSKPIIATMVLLVGLVYWNDWTNGLYYINKDKYYSIQVLLNRMLQDVQFLMSSASSDSSELAKDIPSVALKMAVAVMGALPVLCVYPFFQKYFVKGIVVGAVKG
ncbi:MAG: carbohydrate ABC transporter permease [Roseburia sp.]|jgi:putative aldouronate transport system permease protein|nr:carbohydrate ABC transporter permease [Roseburia sp.]